MIRDLAALMFSDWIWMLATAVSKRLCTAPRLARALFTWSSALSIWRTASEAPA